ncbi:potassium channel family protein [Symmachiella dynata]|uniref:Voltage-gated potassium channel Kch n=1 Tax=Symmachiella dynata TaxID=2527995 RepID=A0A517ZL99_9PLAN|nr:TrkA family potassium uptake protein [Symmachiella dynata]QDT47654.1 Voltage-gated potassium channel Kch [Symmachiella dynata]QDU43236.1 Voltage-gated potassium channel Kch [Symmachiella dynata]
MRRILIIILLLLVLTTVGIIGFRLIEGWDWIDCVYYTVVTVTTVGYEIHPLSDEGKLFVTFYLVTCLGIFTYSAFQLGQWVVSAEMRSFWELRRMQKKIDQLDGHFIVCGMGRMGHTICENLEEQGQAFVVIDTNDERVVSLCHSKDWPYVVGDATDDGILQLAAIDRAKSLATVLPTDADNIYVCLTARLMAPELQIVVRASDDKAAAKMRQAGANRVVSPYRQGALKMARFMVSPNVEDFLEIAGKRGQELELVDIQVADDSPYVGKQLTETNLRAMGVMIIGIRRNNGERLMPPPGAARIESGDCLFAFGSSSAINQMIGNMPE